MSAQAVIYSIPITQETTNRTIQNNQEYIKFLDVSISNFGSKEELDKFHKANEHFYDGALFFLQNQYSPAYAEVNKSMEILKYLYSDILKNKYLVDTKKLLDDTAVSILHSNDIQAKHYLNLGYRNYELARQLQVKGHNFNKYLFSQKIKYFIEGIETARLAKKYGLLALVESRTTIFEKEAYRKRNFNETYGYEENPQISGFEKVENQLKNFIFRKLIDNKSDFFLHHYDNFKYYFTGKSSALKESTNRMKISNKREAENSAMPKRKQTPKNKENAPEDKKQTTPKNE